MLRQLAATRAFPVLAWAFLAGIGIQVFFAGMFVFDGPANIEFHRLFAHVLVAISTSMTIAVFVGRVPEKRMLFTLIGLFVLQGMLVHVNQWFGLSMVAALHPVNALVMGFASLALARRASTYWGRMDEEPMRQQVAASATA